MIRATTNACADELATTQYFFSDLVTRKVSLQIGVQPHLGSSLLAMPSLLVVPSGLQGVGNLVSRLESCCKSTALRLGSKLLTPRWCGNASKPEPQTHPNATLRTEPKGWAVLAVLCCAVLCCAVLGWAGLCCAVLCCAVLCCAVLCCAVLCCAVLCCAVLMARCCPAGPSQAAS